MTNWKDHERACAALISGHRYPANSGGKVDVASERYVAQCKEVKELSLAGLTRLVQDTDAEAAKVRKRGVVFVKLKTGRGVPSVTLVVQSVESWTQRCVVCGGPAVDGSICGQCAEAMYSGKPKARPTA